METLTEAAIADVMGTFQQLAKHLRPDHQLNRLQRAHATSSDAMPLPVSAHFQAWVTRLRVQRDLGNDARNTCAPLVDYLAALPDPVWPTSIGEYPQALERGRLVEQAFALMDQQEASDLWQQWLMSPPPRPADISGRKIDLTDHYNVSLFDHRSWHGEPSLLLEALLGLTEHDARGAIQLASRNIRHSASARAYPTSVSDIAVGQQASRLRVLLGVYRGETAPGRGVLEVPTRYADGTQHTFELLYKEDVIDWQATYVPKPDRALFVPHAPDAALQLTDVELVNPYPDLEIESIALRSADGHAAPFVIGILTEP